MTAPSPKTELPAQSMENGLLELVRKYRDASMFACKPTSNQYQWMDQRDEHWAAIVAFDKALSSQREELVLAGEAIIAKDEEIERLSRDYVDACEEVTRLRTAAPENSNV